MDTDVSPHVLGTNGQDLEDRDTHRERVKKRNNSTTAATWATDSPGDSSKVRLSLRFLRWSLSLHRLVSLSHVRWCKSSVYHVKNLSYFSSRSGAFSRTAAASLAARRLALPVSGLEAQQIRVLKSCVIQFRASETSWFRWSICTVFLSSLDLQDEWRRHDIQHGTRYRFTDRFSHLFCLNAHFIDLFTHSFMTSWILDSKTWKFKIQIQFFFQETEEYLAVETIVCQRGYTLNSNHSVRLITHTLKLILINWSV